MAIQDKIESVKARVRQYSVIPFSPKHIETTPEVGVLRVVTPNSVHPVACNRELLTHIGLGKRLTDDIFNDNGSKEEKIMRTAQNWGVIRDAICKLDKNKRFSAIADEHGQFMSMTETVPEAIPLDYDEAIDDLVSHVDKNGDSFEINEISFFGHNASVQLNVLRKNHTVTVGRGDDWSYGTSVSISRQSNAFTQYFLRLVCTNGMTTREKLAYRSSNYSKHLGRQFMKYSGDLAFAQTIRPRVERLRNVRASLREYMDVASAVPSDKRDNLMPGYHQLELAFKNAGYPIAQLNGKQRSTMYTNHNLYDIFNVATNLATHCEELSTHNKMNLNSAAARIFTKAPDMDKGFVDIFQPKDLD